MRCVKRVSNALCVPILRSEHGLVWSIQLHSIVHSWDWLFGEVIHGFTMDSGIISKVHIRESSER